MLSLFGDPDLSAETEQQNRRRLDLLFRASLFCYPRLMGEALSSERHSERRLLNAVERALGASLSGPFSIMKRPRRWAPFRKSVTFLVVYGLLWLAIEEMMAPAFESEPRLVTLIGWGAFFFATALYLAQSRNMRILEIVRCDIVPHASRDYEEEVATALDRRFGLASLFSIPLLIAAISLVATWWAVEGDLSKSIATLAADHPGEFIFFSISYFVFFFVFAGDMLAARFYTSFAEKLPIESDSFYIMGAADTPLIKGLAKLGAHVLTYWILIFLLFLLSTILLAFAVPEAYGLPPQSRFLFRFVPLASFFSLGFGTLIYLRGEARIRATVQRFANWHAARFQRWSNALVEYWARRYPDRVEDAEELRRITERHDRILAGGHYGSRAGAGISFALPFILPAATLAVALIGG